MAIEPFVWDEKDPLAKEHSQLAALLGDTLFGTLGTVQGEFQSLSKLRRAMARAEGEELKRLALSFFIQGRHFEAQVRSIDVRNIEALGEVMLRAWKDAGSNLSRIQQLIAFDVDWRKVNFDREHAVALLRWASITEPD